MGIKTTVEARIGNEKDIVAALTDETIRVTRVNAPNGEHCLLVEYGEEGDCFIASKEHESVFKVKYTVDTDEVSIDKENKLSRFSFNGEIASKTAARSKGSLEERLAEGTLFRIGD